MNQRNKKHANQKKWSVYNQSLHLNIIDSNAKVTFKVPFQIFSKSSKRFICLQKNINVLIFQGQTKVPLAIYFFFRVQDLGKMVKTRKVHCNISLTFAKCHKRHSKIDEVSVHTSTNHTHSGENYCLWFP